MKIERTAWGDAVKQYELAMADVGSSFNDCLARSFAEFDNALADTIPKRDGFRIEVANKGFVNLPMPWPEFNRMCWRIYGTGRTEPDE